jgi:amino-acid N-acetyltransferase
MKFEIEKPTLKDISGIQDILKSEIDSGVVLYRSDDEVATNIRSYLIAKSEKKIIGVVALHIYSHELAEFRSMVIKKQFRGLGVGKSLIEKGFEVGKELGVKKFLVLTYKKEFFQKLEFSEIEKVAIPNSKIWADCVKCSSFPICDEIALIREF